MSLTFKRKIQTSALKHLKFEEFGNKSVVTLLDAEEFEILKGYGKTIEDAINDLHQNLL